METSAALVVPGAWQGRLGAEARRLIVAPAASPAIPSAIERWMVDGGAPGVRLDSADAVMAEVLRARPQLALLDARGGSRALADETLVRLKRDAFTAIVPAIALVDGASDVAPLLEAGADDVLVTNAAPDEWTARLDAAVRRAMRDQWVHPTTRLPGTPRIEAELLRRLEAGEPFAACYADLDHFKEFNDRYGYTEGDRVIRMVALILHDVVVGVAGERGFVGHIGGDDFFFVLPLESVSEACETVVETFEALVPLQYGEADRRAGYYMGKDRRGQLHRVPLMSLSIGVVTNERRRFTHPGQVSRLASEMKTYAKAQTGSLYAIDRRADD